MSEEEMTPEELETLREMVGVGIPKPDEKHNIFATFNKIIRSTDSTKVANLEPLELSAVRLLQDIANDVKVAYPELKGCVNHLRNKAEIILATSDSKGGFLVKSLITTKKESSIKQKSELTQGGKKGWGKKKEKETYQDQ